MILNNKMTEAQIENIKADTAGKEISNKNEGEGGINQTVKYWQSIKKYDGKRKK